MSSSAADNGSAAYTSSNMNTNGAQRAPPETPDSERASFHSARSIPAPKVVQVSNQLENVLDSGLEPLDQDGTPMAMQTEPKTPRNTTPQGFKRHTSGENEPPARRGTWFGRLLGHLPDWLQEALSTSRAWKNWFRSMVAALAMMIMMVAKKTAATFAGGSFFGFLCSQMIAPNMTTTIFFLAQCTVGVGMLLGWAWGCAAMAAATSVRDPNRLRQQLGGVLSGHQENEDIAQIVKGEAFHAAFLDPRASAVYGAFMFIGSYGLGWIRATKPKLVFLVVFATIIMDSMLTIGPLIPKNYFPLATVLIKPAAAYMAVGLVSTVLIFPETLSHHVLKLHIREQLKNIYSLLAIQNDVIHTTIQNHDDWKELSRRIAAMRDASTSASAIVISEGRMLPLEISYGRIGPKEMQSILKAGRELGSRAFAMGSFAMMIEGRYKNWSEWKAHPHPVATLRIKEEIELIESRKNAGGLSLDDLMPQVAFLSQELRQVAELVMLGEIEWLEKVNYYRYSKLPKDFPGIESRSAALHALEDELLRFRQSKQLKILDGYRGMFDAEGKLKSSVAPHLATDMRPLFQMFVFTTTLVQFCSTLIEWAQLLIGIEAANPNNVLQFPGRKRFFSTLWSSAKDEDTGEDAFDFSVHDPLKDNKQSVDEGGSLGVFADDEKEFKKSVKRDKKIRRRFAKNPDARKPVNIFQHINATIVHVVKVLSSSNGVFALRYAFISIALWTPAVCSNSAAFYYVHRGVWALIMAQCGLGVTAGEQVANFVTRMGGTLLGVVVGMVAWYIGAPGNADGNAYGVVAATMCLLAPWLFIRTCCPMSLLGFWLMFCVTISFLVGYSWDDNKIPSSANQGTGASLAGRRALLVLIGFAGGMIISLIPKPTSAKVLVRQGISKNIASLGELYALEVTAFETGRGDEDAEVDVKQRRERYRHHFFKIFMRLQGIESRIKSAKFEPSMTGPWPKSHYVKLVHSQKMILAAGAVLSGAYAKMDEKYCRFLTNLGGIMEPMFIADCFSLFALLRHALRNGTPLPPIVPIFERLIYHRKSTTARMLVAQESRAQHDSHVTDESSSSQSSQTVDGGEKDSSGSEEGTLSDAENRLVDLISPYVNWNTIRDEQFAIFATALVCLVQIVNGLNQMHIEVLQLVGIHKLGGFEHLAERWARLGRIA